MQKVKFFCCVFKNSFFFLTMSQSGETVESESLVPPESLKIEQLSLAEGEGGGDEPSTPKSDGKQKIDILLKATGNAPIMKKKKWAVDAEKKIGSVIEFIKKYLRLDPSENLFLYVNQAFAPSPDQMIKNLYECFGADGKLVLHYCKSQAWG